MVNYEFTGILFSLLQQCYYLLILSSSVHAGNSTLTGLIWPDEFPDKYKAVEEHMINFAFKCYCKSTFLFCGLNHSNHAH